MSAAVLGAAFAFLSVTWRQADSAWVSVFVAMCSVSIFKTGSYITRLSPYSHVAGANCKLLVLLPLNARVLGVPHSTRFR